MTPNTPDATVPQPAPTPAAPSDLDGIPPLPLWPVESYEQIVDGPGGEKLHTSAVAPLVAAARGYAHVGEDRLKETAKRLRLGPASTKRHRSFVSTIEQGSGAMMMPKYQPEVCVKYDPSTGEQPAISVVELKPVLRIIDHQNPDKLTGKYKGIAGESQVIDIHPATPRHWVAGPTHMVISEGVLKGDAGLTAILRRAGVSDDVLAQVPDTQAEAIAVLRALLEALPENRATVFANLAGVGNWHSNPEWNEVEWKGRTVWLAFDGDIASNAHVWKQASGFWKMLVHKKAHPLLLDLRSHDGTLSDQGKPFGLDDWLAEVGPWETLPRQIVQALPNPPAGKGGDHRKGDVRVNEDTDVVEVYEPYVDPNTGRRSGTWEPLAEMAGRVTSMIASRSADDEEMLTATIDTGFAGDTDVELEVFWRDPSTGERESSTISGSDVLLAEPPSEWHKTRIGAVVPPEVKAHPDWPPSPSWLKAVKAHRPEDKIKDTQWDHMGWVPTNIAGQPAFIVGAQAINARGFTDVVKPGVTDSALSGASNFGVSEAPSEEDLKEAIVEVLETFIGAFKDRRHASAIISIALRPTVPRIYNTPAAFIGPPGSGKSLAAGYAMNFWQHRPGTWSRNHLPGSAKDTATATELAVSRSCIWVIDDLAPSQDDRTERLESAKMADVLRGVFNRARKRRSNASLGSQDTNIPRSVLMITGENNRFAGSVESRYLLLQFKPGSLNKEPMERLNALGSTTHKMAWITFAVIKMIAGGEMAWNPFTRETDSIPWVDAVDAFESEYTYIHDVCHDQIAEDKKRTAENAADASLGLAALMFLCRRLNMMDEEQLVSDMREDIISLSMEHLAGQSTRTPGQTVLSAVRSLLSSGQAHIESASGSSAPIVNDKQSALMNSQLGWIPDGGGNLRPGGPKIGYLVAAEDRDPIILLDAQNAFNLASRLYKDLILAGRMQNDSWESMWNEGITCPDGEPYKRQKDGATLRPIVRVNVSNVTLRGVPIRLSTLTGAMSTDVDEDAEDTEPDTAA
ncbi:MAG: hypothetical protein WKF57_03800 [Nakamurella sp.]